MFTLGWSVKVLLWLVAVFWAWGGFLFSFHGKCHWEMNCSVLTSEWLSHAVLLYKSCCCSVHLKILISWTFVQHFYSSSAFILSKKDNFSTFFRPFQDGLIFISIANLKWVHVIPDCLVKQTVRVICGHFNGAQRGRWGQINSVYGKPVHLSHWWQCTWLCTTCLD